MTSVTKKELTDYANNFISTMKAVADNVLDTAQLCQQREKTLCDATIKKVDEFKKLLNSFQQLEPQSNEDMIKWNMEHSLLRENLKDLVKNQVSILRADGHYSFEFFSLAALITGREIVYHV